MPLTRLPEQLVERCEAAVVEVARKAIHLCADYEADHQQFGTVIPDEIFELRDWADQSLVIVRNVAKRHLDDEPF